jgi:hypothetical protein
VEGHLPAVIQLEHGPLAVDQKDDAILKEQNGQHVEEVRRVSKQVPLLAKKSCGGWERMK